MCYWVYTLCMRKNSILFYRLEGNAHLGNYKGHMFIFDFVSDFTT